MRLPEELTFSAAAGNAVLLRSNGDELLLRDAQALLDGSKTECADYPGGRSRLIDELARSGQPGIDAILAIHQRLQTIREILSDCLGESGVPEMEQLQKTVGIVAGACQITDISSFHASREESAVSEHQAIYDVPPPTAVDWRSAQISSRAEAQQMLEKVKQYFAQHEPSHPAPLMIERVQRLIELDFMDIIRDLAPDGVHQLENIFGRHD